MMIIRDMCPRCTSPKYKKNGHIHNGKQHHHGHDCGQQFVQCCEPYLLAEDTRGLIERILGERISLRGIAQFIVATRGRKVDCLAWRIDQTCCSINSILRGCAGR